MTKFTTTFEKCPGSPSPSCPQGSIQGTCEYNRSKTPIAPGTEVQGVDILTCPNIRRQYNSWPYGQGNGATTDRRPTGKHSSPATNISPVKNAIY